MIRIAHLLRVQMLPAMMNFRHLILLLTTGSLSSVVFGIPVLSTDPGEVPPLNVYRLTSTVWVENIIYRTISSDHSFIEGGHSHIL
jgi:hypothetical protein